VRLAHDVAASRRLHFIIPSGSDLFLHEGALILPLLSHIHTTHDFLPTTDAELTSRGSLPSRRGELDSLLAEVRVLLSAGGQIGKWYLG